MTTSEPTDDASAALHEVRVYFCGERYVVAKGGQFVIGREADLVVDDNPYLHRQFLTISDHGDLFWLVNVGNNLSATVSHVDGTMQAWLSPGAHLPLVFPLTVVRFTAGTTTYQVEVEVMDPPFSPGMATASSHGTTTIGVVPLTTDQRLLILALAENVLRGDSRSGASVPASARAAERLGWALTKFNRKLDNVCDKLTKAGVQGLHGNSGELASSRRTRLVEYAVAVRLVEVEDLRLLANL